jgi:chorismate mutase/prephenate dehydratase
LAVRVSELKHRRGRPIFDQQREQQVLHQVAAANPGPLPQEALLKIYREILRASRTVGLHRRT